MLELTPDNVVSYLRERQIPATVAALLSGGVSNQVLRVETEKGPIVVKQSRLQLRTRDAWYSDLDRIYREQEVMEALEPALPPGTVPHVLFADRPNYVYAMNHAPEDARVWKAELLAGALDLGLGERVGRVLGRMHEASARDPARFAAFSDRTVYVQLRVDPFYRRVMQRRPEVAEPLGRLVDELLTRHDALCHADFTPKNILAHAAGFTLVDYETAHVGDPAMDLGLFLAHLTLKAIRQPGAPFVPLMQAFWRGYLSEATFAPAAELEQRGVRHLGACLLARVDGTSPIDYLPDETQREAVRRLGRALLLGELTHWADVWEKLHGE